MSIVLHFEIEKGEPIDWCNFSARIKLTDSSKNYLREKLGNNIKFDNLDGYYNLNPENFHIHYSKNDDRNILHIKDEEGYCLTSNILLNRSVFSVELSSSNGSIIDYGFYPTQYSVRGLDIYKEYKDSSFNDTKKKLLPTTQDILAKLLNNTNELSVSEVSLQVQNKINEAIAKEEQAKRDVEEKLMEEHKELTELINNDQIILFKVIKGQGINGQNTTAALQLQGTDKYIDLDPEKYYISREYVILNNSEAEYLVCKENNHKNIYIDYENAFFVLNRSPHHNLPNGFYRIYNGSYGKDLINGAGYLKDKELPGKLLSIVDGPSKISEVYKEESTVNEVHTESSNDVVVKNAKETDQAQVMFDQLIKLYGPHSVDKPESKQFIQDIIGNLKTNDTLVKNTVGADQVSLGQLTKLVRSSDTKSSENKKFIKDYVERLQANNKTIEDKSNNDSNTNNKEKNNADNVAHVKSGKDKVVDSSSNKVINSNNDKVINNNKVISSSSDTEGIESVISNDTIGYKKADKIIEFIQNKDPGALSTLIKSLKPYGTDSPEGKKLIGDFMDYFRKNYQLEFSQSLNGSMEKSNNAKEEDSNIREKSSIKEESNVIENSKKENNVAEENNVIEYSKKESNASEKNDVINHSKKESNLVAEDNVIEHSKKESNLVAEDNVIEHSKKESNASEEDNVVEYSKKENQSKKLEDEQEVIIASVMNSMDNTSEHPLKVNKGDPLDVGKYRVELNVKYNDILNLYNNVINKYQVEKAYNYDHVKVLYDQISHISLSNSHEQLVTLPEAYITNDHLFIQNYDFGSINNFNDMFY